MSEAIISPHGSQLSENMHSDDLQQTVVPLANPALPERWRFTHGIDELSDVEYQPIISRGATIGEFAIYRYIMDDGSTHLVREGRPSHPQIDTALVKTGAFITHSSRGMNVHHQHRDVRLGYTSLFISRELGWEGRLDQGRTAYNMAKITKDRLQKNGSVDETNIVLSGLSRGAMISLGIKAMADNRPDLQLNPYYLNAIAPCYPNRLRPHLKYLMFPLTESVSLGTHLMSLPIPLLKKYPGTLDLNPRAMKAGARALSNGDAGKFADLINLDAHGFVVALPDDVMGMGDIWVKKFKNHPNMHVEMAKPSRLPLSNGHLRLVDYNDLTHSQQRLERLVDAKRYEPGLDLDYDFINGSDTAA